MMNTLSWPGSDIRTERPHYFTAERSVGSSGLCKIPGATTRTGTPTTVTPRPGPAWLWVSLRWQGHPESTTWVRPFIWYWRLHNSNTLQKILISTPILFYCVCTWYQQALCDTITHFLEWICNLFLLNKLLNVWLLIIKTSWQQNCYWCYHYHCWNQEAILW